MHAPEDGKRSFCEKRGFTADTGSDRWITLAKKEGPDSSSPFLKRQISLLDLAAKLSIRIFVRMDIHIQLA